MSEAWSSLTHAQRREALRHAKQQYEEDTQCGDEDGNANDSDSCSCASEGWPNATASLTLEALDLQFWSCFPGSNEPFEPGPDSMSILHFLDCVQWDE